MQVFLISLERLPARGKRVESRLKALGVAYEVFRAVDGGLGEERAYPQYDAAACLRHFGATLLPAEVGCFASHYRLWQRCVLDDTPIAVLEDDIGLRDGFPEALAAAEAEIDRYRFIRLAGLVERAYRPIREIGDRRLVRFCRGPEGTQAYCLSPQGAAALLARSKQWREPVDLYIDRFWIHGVKPFAIVPFEVVHGDATFEDSTIGPRIHKRAGLNKLRREVRRLGDSATRWFYNFRDEAGQRGARNR